MVDFSGSQFWIQFDVVHFDIILLKVTIYLFKLSKPLKNELSFT